AAHRHRADVRRGAEHLGRQRADGGRRAGDGQRRLARRLEGHDRPGRADHALSPARARAHGAPERALRDARDVKTTEAPAAARPLAVTGGAREGILSRYGLWLGAAVVLIVLPWVVRTGAAVPIMNQMGIAIVFALSFNMLLGQGGMLSFGHAVYFGLGGFLAAHALNIAGRGGLYLPVPLLPLVGGLGGLVF